MNISLSPLPPRDVKADLLAIACDDEGLAENPTISALDQALGGTLRRAVQDERFRAKAGQSITLHTQGRLPATRIALFGMGSRAAVKPASLHSFAGRAARLANTTGAATLALLPPPAAGDLPA